MRRTHEKLDTALVTEFAESEKTWSYRPLRILLLADDKHSANTVLDHIHGFSQFSCHEYVTWNCRRAAAGEGLDLDDFDVLIIHYSIFVLSDAFLAPDMADRIRAFSGLKLQFIQDEYRQIDAINRKAEYLGIHAIVSALRPAHADLIYDYVGQRGVTRLCALPGYVPEHLLTRSVAPIAQRQLHLVYRVRPQPFWLGGQAQTKTDIGRYAAEHGPAHGLSVDIGVKESDRVYGEDWIRLTSRARAALAAAGGASVFDFDGTIHQRVNQYRSDHPDHDFETVWRATMRDVEGNVVHEQPTPRIFEAAALRTALVMPAADYRGVVRPGEHFIELAKDYSNFAEVARLLKDDVFLQALVDKTYDDLISSGLYLRSRFVQGFDRVLERLCVHYGEGGSVRLPTNESGGQTESREWDMHAARSQLMHAQSEEALRSGTALRDWLSSFAYRCGHLVLSCLGQGRLRTRAERFARSCWRRIVL